MHIEIISCPRCGKRMFLYEDGHAECHTCGLMIGMRPAEKTTR